MKKIYVFLAVLLTGLVLNVNAQQKKGQLEGDSPDPQIKFEFLEYDFGTVKKGTDMKIDFKFTNTGKSPLILNNVKSSCGCTTPSWPKEPIAPGKGNSIKVEYDSKRVGPFTKSITISTNAKTPSIDIIIKGTVEDVHTKK
ncbi:MAG: hypothetical protein A2275_16070 [Bacteroidetes bacterium RIFOXYA12_FULL_35_11]|nr:MAG: hypothetical protein A2X01_05240 [Bacteroidetes bacterium GWF2_35_48]OFY75894.1 MAG: hypothetical protein A2275_16070 [Bacteroidetes bacterium RIFOXYA12_FULL_35_11]OFY99382.1 MAG: hypothetical protein A2491_11470 [Bacteroidetes bacterium RIFOXYC12_FULL_35_7]HBX52157.1 hypothetical protein [Bacteroidales bacterium]